ncbi:hypothetical protein FOXYSP1_20615 [Fusarium oxysporum f. sp. phaseoli]
MRYTEILGLAMSNVAAAQFSATRLTDTTTSAIKISTPTISTKALDAAGENNDNLYAEACFSASFFGLYDKKYYCGSDLELLTSPLVGAEQCGIACPGDADVSCSGLAAGSRFMRRQVDPSILLSVYVAVGVSVGETGIIVKTDFAIDP